MIATRACHVEIGFASVLTAALLAIAPPGRPDAGPPMPDPSPEVLTDTPDVTTQTLALPCGLGDITALVVRGRITNLGEGLAHAQITFWRGADTGVTDTDGYFEIRIPRAMLDGTDLCKLPVRGHYTGLDPTVVDYKLLVER